jgi:hypothetical protein
VYDSEVGRQVRSSFQALAQRPDQFSDADETQLRERVSAAVDELRLLGWPAEQVIVRVKELAAETGLRLGYRPFNQREHPVVAKVVLWCVERYYERK